MLTSLRIAQAIERLKDVYLASPHAGLTVQEAAEIAGIDSEACTAILGALTDAGFLALEDGVFRRPRHEVGLPAPEGVQ